MSKHRVWLLVAAAVICLGASQAGAQVNTFYQGRSDNPVGPTVSPYLNLVQNNSVFSQASNYQSLVKPLINQNAAIKNQGNRISALQSQVSQYPAGGGAGLGNAGTGRVNGGTGHATSFMNYSHYYPAPRRGG